jgi:HEAT repeat protein
LASRNTHETNNLQILIDNKISQLIDDNRIARAKGIQNNSVKVLQEGHSVSSQFLNPDTGALKYVVRIDYKTKTVFHDCPDWERRADSKKICKHIMKLLLLLPIDLSSSLVSQVVFPNTEWTFSYPNNTSVKLTDETLIDHRNTKDYIDTYVNDVKKSENIPFLVKSLFHEKTTIRKNAAQTLGQIGNTIAVEPLIKSLGDKRATVRFSAAEALGEIGDNRAVGRLIDLLSDSAMVRRSAARALGLIGDATAVLHLIALLNEEDGLVRSRTIEALGRIGDSRAFEPLIGILGEPIFQNNAAISLGRLGDNRAFDPLIEALRSTQYTVRRDIAIGLGYLGDPRAIEPLLEILNESSYTASEGIAKALGLIGDPRAVETLIMMLNHPQYCSQRTVALALGRIGDTRAVGPLAHALDNPSFEFRERTISEMMSLGNTIVVTLALEAIRGKNSQIEHTDHDLYRTEKSQFNRSQNSLENKYSNKNKSNDQKISTLSEKDRINYEYLKKEYLKEHKSKLDQ